MGSALVRPRCRADCVDGLRPCPWVGCRYHLYLYVLASGKIRYNFGNPWDAGGCWPWEMGETCVLDLARQGGLTLREIGVLMNVTRERIRQIQAGALVHARRALHGLVFSDLA